MSRRQTQPHADSMVRSLVLRLLYFPKTGEGLLIRTPASEFAGGNPVSPVLFNLFQRTPLGFRQAEVGEEQTENPDNAENPESIGFADFFEQNGEGQGNNKIEAEVGHGA